MRNHDNELAGHNNPPNPIDEAMTPFDAFREEAEGWLDGKPVETEGQMLAVDTLIKQMKAAKKAVEGAEESAAKPIYDQWKAKKAEFKPTLDDLDRIVKGLVAAVDGFKRKLAAEKEAVRKAAERKAWEAAEEARKAALAANASDIEDQRNAAAKQAEAEAAMRGASAAKNDTVKGLRWHTFRTVDDSTIFARWIWNNDRAAFEGTLANIS
ncbi:MAG: hypothetical protein U5N55_03530 [Cypionkella sp.]|nr:hypothetical protein [Cypionkella sp.]